ncbi:cyclophane-containing peptide 2OG-Fe(II) oxygenase YhhC [Blastococcus mobilis]|uniref:2OG-Fe(II) oxygenase superfamily protein n=1 Tax=Blastococcus mobilis TaxID=1938746 RepID=A0A238YAF4_9ACTN|nr:cyclophane-containing peptide 2OG-Fe(II) oxygenase YhhC [Blastococcus mobilis]SNR67603.1 2OG-Fe(II) oxygenase superfamily protein [Blastococcus mobilis]
MTTGAPDQLSGDRFANGDVEIRGTPFLYCVADAFVQPQLADALLRAMETTTEWILHSGDFFEQYEWDLARSAPSGDMRRLFDPVVLDELRRTVARLFDCDLEHRVKVVAHRLEPGQGIGVHNDAPRPGDETHRVVLHLGHEYDDRHGGHLVFLNGPDGTDLHRIFRPLHNTAVGFAMSDASFHAVSTVRSRVRYSVVFSFWERKNPDQPPAPGDRHPSITVSRRLADSEDVATALVFEMFPERYPVATEETGEDRTFTLRPSVTPGANLDAGLSEALRSVTGITPALRAEYRVLRQHSNGRFFLRSLDHHWALWAWSKWLAANPGSQPTLLVHLDSHDDLGSPPLAVTPTPGVFDLPLGQDRVDIAAPGTVSAAITAGRIGIGSFIAPFLHGLRHCDVYHAWHSDHAGASAFPMWLDEEPLRAPLSGCRPVISPNGSGERARIVGTYTRGELDGIAGLAPDGPVLLDIDMDFFCNRFGVGDAANHGAATTLPDVCSVIDQLGEVLTANRALSERIAVVTLALSPGFFPSEFWEVALPRLEDMLTRVLDAFSPAAPTGGS